MFHGLHRLDISGHVWTLYLYARPGYISGAEESQPTFVAFGGILVDLLLFVIIGSFSRQQKRADLMTRRTLGLVERERARLSRELHDGIGQSLVALNISLQQARRSTGDGPAATALDRTHEITSQLVLSVRELAHGLRPSQLDDLGLAAALRAHLDKVVRPLGITASIAENLGEQRLPPECELCCFRVAQEAMANALRHADATELQVAIAFDGTLLSLSVRDNGRGFDTETFERRPEQLHSLGLLGMQERVTALGGLFKIRSAPGDGTEVSLTLTVTPA
jgi:signal transduction histidine kinase